MITDLYMLAVANKRLTNNPDAHNSSPKRSGFNKRASSQVATLLNVADRVTHFADPLHIHHLTDGLGFNVQRVWRSQVYVFWALG